MTPTLPQPRSGRRDEQAATATYRRLAEMDRSMIRAAPGT